MAKKDSKLNLINKLQKFLASKDAVSNSIISDAASRILSVLISDHEHYQEYIEDTKILIGVIVSNTMYSSFLSSKSTKTLSDYISAVCLSQILMVPGITKFFIEKSGVYV